MARIMMISRNFPPLTGGMERLFHQLYLQLSGEHQTALLGPAGSDAFVRDDCDVRTTTVSPTPWFLLASLGKGLVLRPAGRHPEMIIGGSGLVAPIVVLLAKMRRARSVLLLHGLDIVADSYLYQRLFVPFLKRADMLVCNSRNTARLALRAGADEQRITIVHPGVDMPQNSLSQNDAKRSLGLAGKTVLLSIGRLIPRKGLPEYVARGFSEFAAQHTDAVLLIAGFEPSQALNRRSSSVLGKLQSAITDYNLEDRVRLLGQVDDRSSHALYSAADAFVFPLQETVGDVEGFGMVAVEAAARGTPTVAFDCGGVADAVAEGVSGFLVSPGDYQAFNGALERAIDGGLRDSSRQFASRFAWEKYGEQMRDVVTRVLQ